MDAAVENSGQNGLESGHHVCVGDKVFSVECNSQALHPTKTLTIRAQGAASCIERRLVHT